MPSERPHRAPSPASSPIGGADTLNLAEVCRATRALGPGQRYAVWVQGCPFRCPGCIARDWQASRVNRLIPVTRLAEDILATPDLEGLTLSGGEPMWQAPACLGLMRAVRRQRPALTLILYTGYRLEALRAAGDSACLALLGETDVLIDGRYERARNDNRGLRGSANQRVHFLSERYLGLGASRFTGQARRVELHFRRESLFLVGIPPAGVAGTLAEMTETP